MKKSSYRVAFCGVMTAFALVLGYIEHLVPLPIGIYGIKLGLANILPLTLLSFSAPLLAFSLNFLRIILSGILFGNPISIIYSMAGAILSGGVMLISKKLLKLSTVSVGILGGVSHNLGQICVAVFLTETPKIALYFPILAITGALTGLLVGVISTLLSSNKQIFSLFSKTK